MNSELVMEETNNCIQVDSCLVTPSTSTTLKSDITENETKLELTESKENENSKQLVDTFLKALCHAVVCTESNCRVEKCTQFKRIIQHSSSCKKVNSQCDYCRQLVALCVVHAKSCQDNSCQVPDCHVIKVKLAQLEEFKAKSQSIIEFVQTNLKLLKFKSKCHAQIQTDSDAHKIELINENGEQERVQFLEKIEKIKQIPTERMTSREEKLAKFDRKLRNHLVKQLIEIIVEKFSLKDKDFYKNISYATLVAYFIKTEAKLHSKTNNSDDYLILLTEFVHNLEKEFSKKIKNQTEIETQTECVSNKSKSSDRDHDEDDNIPPSKKVKFDK